MNDARKEVQWVVVVTGLKTGSLTFVGYDSEFDAEEAGDELCKEFAAHAEPGVSLAYLVVCEEV